MRFISTKVHGILDYAVGVLLILAPWLFDFAYMGAETWIPVIVGAMVLAMSLMTDYELGAVHMVPVPTHLWIDVAGGVLLAASPWLFGFADVVYVPHLVFGLMEIVVPFLTEKHPSYERGGGGTTASVTGSGM